MDSQIQENSIGLMWECETSFTSLTLPEPHPYGKPIRLNAKFGLFSFKAQLKIVIPIFDDGAYREKTVDITILPDAISSFKFDVSPLPPKAFQEKNGRDTYCIKLKLKAPMVHSLSDAIHETLMSSKPPTQEVVKKILSLANSGSVTIFIPSRNEPKRLNLLLSFDTIEPDTASQDLADAVSIQTDSDFFNPPASTDENLQSNQAVPDLLSDNDAESHDSSVANCAFSTPNIDNESQNPKAVNEEPEDCHLRLRALEADREGLLAEKNQLERSLNKAQAAMQNMEKRLTQMCFEKDQAKERAKRAEREVKRKADETDRVFDGLKLRIRDLSVYACTHIPNNVASNDASQGSFD